MMEGKNEVTFHGGEPEEKKEKAIKKFSTYSEKTLNSVGKDITNRIKLAKALTVVSSGLSKNTELLQEVKEEIFLLKEEANKESNSPTFVKADIFQMINSGDS